MTAIPSHEPSPTATASAASTAQQPQQMQQKERHQRQRRRRQHDDVNGGGEGSTSIIRNDDDNVNDDSSSSDFAALATAGSLEIITTEEEEEEHLQHLQHAEIHHQQPRQRQQSYCAYLCSTGHHSKSSLARAPTTPMLLRWLVPLLSITTHGIFLYGQLAPMWRLHLSVNVDAWANATTYESRSVFSTIGLPVQNHVYSSQESDVKEFTFMFAITELWKAVGMPGKVLPRMAAILLILFSGAWPHMKLVLLQGTFFTCFHHANNNNPAQRRTRILHWLSTLGKWSLADVLAVCVMVGVLHLDWIVDPVAMKQGLITNFPLLLVVARAVYGPNAADLCSAGLAPLNCHDQHANNWDDWSKCQACLTLVNSALDHPDVAQRTVTSVLNGVDVSGNGLIYLRVQGMRGIYAFCLAVIMSILISLLVDILDVWSNNHSHSSSIAYHHHDDDDDETDQEDEEEIIFQSNNNNNSNNHTFTAAVTTATMSQFLDVNQNGEDDNIINDFDTNLGAPLLLVPPPLDNTDTAVANRRPDRNRPRRRRLRFRAPPAVNASCCQDCLRCCSIFCSTSVTFGLVWSAVSYHTIGRVVTGAIPQVLEKVLGVVWNRPYSLYSLVQTTGAAGGFDYLLMATFGLFVVAGPVIRALLCILAALTNTTSATITAASASSSSSSRRGRKLLLSSIEFIGAFCAWEVFAAAVFMVNLLMPAITSTIIMKPECAELDPETGSCLQVEFQLQPSFALLIIGGALLLLLANSTFGARNLHAPHARLPSSSESSSLAAFEYSMVMQSASNGSGGGTMADNDANDRYNSNDNNATTRTTVDEGTTWTSGIA